MTSAAGMRSGAPLGPGDELVLDYLAAVWAASGDLTPGMRDELMTTVSDYIAMRRSPDDPRDDPAPLLRRLGPPADLADAAGRGHMPPHLRRPVTLGAIRPADPMALAAASTDGSALVVLAAGAVLLPAAAPVAALSLVSSSGTWTRAHKLAAWLLTGLPILGAVLTIALGAVAGHPLPAIMLAYLASAGGALLSAVLLLPAYLSKRRRSM
jgi:hypothetical protein